MVVTIIFFLIPFSKMKGRGNIKSHSILTSLSTLSTAVNAMQPNMFK